MQHKGNKMNAIVSCKGITKTFGKGELAVHALRGIDLEIMQGDFATLAGPSGSGKTTLLNMIGALDHPTSGAVSVDGQSLSGMDKGALSDLRLDKIGFIFQAYNLVPVLSALENVEFVLQLQQIPSAERRKRATEALHEDGREGMEHRRPGAMSGGQQQRVAIARALAGKPKILLADEPTASLDPVNRQRLLDLLNSLKNKRDMRIVLVTHDLGAAKALCEEILVLDHGEMVEHGPTAQVMGQPAHCATKLLIQSQPLSKSTC